VIVLGKPGVDGLREAVDALRGMQHDGLPVQLHPGDLGWQWRFGAEATAAAVWTWGRGGRMLAIGMLDSPRLLRLAVAQEAQSDEELARQMVMDMTRPARGVLPKGDVCVEVRFGDLLRRLLSEEGWVADEAWTPLRRDLEQPVEDCNVPIAITGPGRARVRAAVQRAAFAGSTFTEARWHAMAAGSPYAEARCLVAYDDGGAAAAGATVWSAGPGRPGLLEPMGVHRARRGRGYGTALTTGAAAVLRDMGCSSAVVCTRSSNLGAVATYQSAGFQRLPDVHDLRRGHRGYEAASPASWPLSSDSRMPNPRGSMRASGTGSGGTSLPRWESRTGRADVSGSRPSSTSPDRKPNR
jgi:GNAT superfamily N-acetyltransferase